MVDCRLCKYCYKIWSLLPDSNEYKIVCTIKEHYVDKEYATKGPCEEYVDVDGYDTE